MIEGFIRILLYSFLYIRCGLQVGLQGVEAFLYLSQQAYLKALLDACNAAERRPRQNGAAALEPAPAALSLATPRVAVRCLAMLLTSLPHFNHASDVLQVCDSTAF